MKNTSFNLPNGLNNQTTLSHVANKNPTQNTTQTLDQIVEELKQIEKDECRLEETPVSQGGKTGFSNLRLLCRDHHMLR